MFFRLRARRAFCLVAALQILAGKNCYRFVASPRVSRASLPTRSESHPTRMAPIVSYAGKPLADSDESSDDEDAIASPEAAGKWLRKACAQQKSEGSLTAISNFLSKLDAIVLAKALGQGNTNGKAALHFASQLRGDDLELVELLLDAGAAVNVATRRGHTPLIFAAGRGHNRIVQLLLSAGANPRVIVVTGDTPVSMGRTRLDPQTFAMLEAAEKSFDGPWMDHRNTSDALQAQAEHMKTCPHCRRKVQQKEAAAEDEKREMLSADLTSRLMDVFDSAPDRTEFVTLIAETCGTRRGRSILDDALQKAIAASLSQGTATLIGLLKLLEEEALGRALHQIGQRDRRPMRTIYSALLKELEMSPHWLDTVVVADITAVASPHLAMEVIRFKMQFAAEDRYAVEELWQKLQAWAQLPSSYTPEISIAAGTSLSRRQGGPAVTELLQRLRWACSMEAVTPQWSEMVDNIVQEASQKQQSEFLYDVINNSRMIPAWAVERLSSGNEKLATIASKAPGCKKYTTSAASPLLPDEEQMGAPDAPEYILPVKYDWVSDDAGLAAVQQFLEGCFESQEKLFVGVDTEWGLCGKTPSVVQLAIPQHAWVIDTATPSPDTRAFFQWLFQCDRASFLGFAFSADADKLAALMRDEQGSAITEIEVTDLQKLAMQHVNDKGRTPGLKSVAEMWLGVHLDKTEQCSDWDRRPLSESQLRYAAADATVLLDIAVAMGLQASSKRESPGDP